MFFTNAHETLTEGGCPLRPSEKPIHLAHNPLNSAGFRIFGKWSFRKVILKPTACFTLFMFVSTQVAWAADVRQMILDAKQSFELENEARRSGLTATELEASQTSQQSLIQQQQALTDLQGENFSLKTQSGDTL
jgi:hypothetical protein